MDKHVSCSEVPKSYEKDPEYELPEHRTHTQFQIKKRKSEEYKIKELTKKRIGELLRKQFLEDILLCKDNELDRIDAMLMETRSFLDRLRGCIITKYYASPELVVNEDGISCIHPAAKKHLDIEKGPHTPTGNNILLKNKCSCDNNISKTDVYVKENSFFPSERDDATHISPSVPVEKSMHEINKQRSNTLELFPHTEKEQYAHTHSSYIKSKFEVIVGNVSKYIPMADRGDNEQHSHIWKAFVRAGKNGPKLSDVVEKVCFLLHQTFAPHDFVEVRNPPFEIAQRGWGDFPLRVRFHFKDPINKPVDIIHRIRLDRTYTGLTTLNSETHADFRILMKNNGASNLSEKKTYAVNSNTHEDSSYSSVVDVENISSCNFADDNFRTSCAEKTHVQETHNGTEMALCENSSTSNSSESSCSSIVCEIDKNQQCTNQMSPTRNLEEKLDFLDSENATLLVPVCVKPNNVKESHNKRETASASLCTNNTEATNGSTLVNTDSTAATTESTLLNSDNTGAPKKNGVFSVISKKQQVTSFSFKQGPPFYFLNVKGKVLLISSEREKEKMTKIQKNSATVNGYPVLSPDRTLTASSPHSAGEETKCRESWKQLIKNIDISDCNNMERVLQKIVKKFPLFKESERERDRSVLPLCCSSVEEYTSWHTAKRRAAEWQRAVILCKAACHVLEKRKKKNLLKKCNFICSSKTVMKWCRKFGYTPNIFHSNFLKKGTSSRSSDECPDDSVSLNSFSDVLEMISSLQNNCTRKTIDGPEAEIDVIDDSSHTFKQNSCATSPQKCTNAPKTHDHLCLPYSCDAARFVTESAAEIKVRLRPVPLDEGIYLPVLEEMILKACKLFAEDVLRSAFAKSYDRIHQGKRKEGYPVEITLMDVYIAVRSNSEFHFLTNKHLAFSKPLLDDS